jgi:hypothetical protein
MKLGGSMKDKEKDQKMASCDVSVDGGKNEEKIAHWERYQRVWYNFYLFLGVGINFVIYFTKPYGLDPGRSIFWGALIGAAIPLATMLLGTAIHKKVIGV